MKIYKRITLSVFVVAVVLSFSASAFSWGEVKKAREFMQAGMYLQAIEVLDKRINDKPTDADAHFQLGVCFINTKNYRGADERFASAVRLQPDYGYKIGGQFQKAGAEKLNNGRLQNAITLFNHAVKYQPGLKKEIAMQCKTKGFAYLEKNKAKEAIMLLTEAAAHQPQLKEEITKILFDKGTYCLNSTTQNKHSENSKTNDPGNLKLTTFNINSKFIDNQKLGKLFVITGKIKNEYSNPRSFIQVAGKLYAKGKTLKASKTVYCGNIISGRDLSNMDLPSIKKRLENKNGDNQSNINIKPDKAVPFMVVFTKLPDDLAEFTIEINESSPAQKL